MGGSGHALTDTVNAPVVTAAPASTTWTPPPPSGTPINTNVFTYAHMDPPIVSSTAVARDSSAQVGTRALVDTRNGSVAVSRVGLCACGWQPVIPS